MTGNIEVVLGAHNISKYEPEQVRCRVLDILIDKDYNKTSKQNDVALLKLSRSVNFTETIQPIGLLHPKQAMEINYQQQQGIIMVGWGRSVDYTYPPSKDLTTLSDVANKVEVKIINTDACKQRWNDNVEYITEKNICTSGYKAVAACRMDDGSPLLLDDHLIGLFSLSSGTCELCAPSIFTNIHYYYDWIQRNSDLPQITYA